MRLDKKILRFLYKRRNDGEYHNLAKELNIEYHKIIGTVQDLLSKNLIDRPTKMLLGAFEDPEGDTLSKNVSCKITQEGILYYEKTIDAGRTKIISVIALFISLVSLLVSIIK